MAVTFQREDSEDAGTTHHTPALLRTIQEDDVMDETATTRHEPLNIKKEEYDMDSKSSKDELDISLRLHRKVAEIASRAYKKASQESNVLSMAKLDSIALVKFEEIQIGKFLGKGSFSNVHEITKITCAPSKADDKDDDEEKSWDGTDGEVDTSRTTEVAGNKSNHVTNCNPRELLTKHHQRDDESGSYRYAIKYLKEEVRSSPQKYAVGTADLVVEGMFLASLAHPNIIKVRGLPEGGVKSLVYANRKHGYFLILDRLFNTLSDQIYKEWSGGHLVQMKKKFGFLLKKKDKELRNQKLAIRLKVAYDISAALKFLHSKNIVYRDLKPENLGFDVRGDIKLFDLGLVKELHPREKNSRGNWRLSMAGTPRYMAPEVGMYQPYNLSADVYSFSMLLWEIMTLEKPLKDYTYTRLKNEIFIDGERPAIKKVFNKRIRSLINSGWSQDPTKRPTIGVVYDELRSEYLNLSPGTVKPGDVSHNRRRSTFLPTPHRMSIRQLMRLNSVESTA